MTADTERRVTVQTSAAGGHAHTVALTAAKHNQRGARADLRLDVDVQPAGDGHVHTVSTDAMRDALASGRFTLEPAGDGHTHDVGGFLEACGIEVELVA